MPTIAFPRRHLAALVDLGARVLDRRAARATSEVLARDLLSGVVDVCLRVGLDGVLAELGEAHGLEPADGAALADDDRLVAALIARLDDPAQHDPRGPRSARPRQLADCLRGALGLEPADPPDRALALPHELRLEVAAALAGAVEPALGAPQLRDAIVAAARARCDERHHKALDKLAAHLDDRGLRLLQQPRLPLDAVQAVQRALSEARTAVIGQAADAAIDRAARALARVSEEAAARLDQPVTRRLTPRQVAIARVTDPEASKAPAAVAQALLDALTELAELAWRAHEPTARPYAIAETYAVGDVIEHPKFGRGTVQTVAAQRIEVAFPAGVHTLVHARGAR